MKTAITLIVLCFFWISIIAQTPQAFKYQAVARNTSGEVLANQSVSFRISIIKGTVTGAIVFTETHKKTTNPFGLVDLEIGRGTPVTGVFSTITWGNDAYFINLEIDPSGGSSYQFLGAGPLLSVPYALQAKNVELEADGDPANELQSLSLNGSQLTLSKGGGTVQLPSSGTGGDNWGSQTVATDATLSGSGLVTNMLRIAQQSATTGQVLKWDGTTWKPSDEMAGGSLWQSNGTKIYYDKGYVGIGITDPVRQLHVHSPSLSSGIQFTNDVSGSTVNDGFIITQQYQSETENHYALIMNNENTPLRIGANKNYNQLVLNPDGNVGVGSVSADAKFQVSGQVRIYGGNPGAGKVLTSDASGLASWQMPSGGLTLPFAGTANISGSGFSVTNSNSDNSSAGITGIASAVTGQASGISGSSASPDGTGVYGKADALTGSNYGVKGRSDSPSGTGVYGIEAATTGAGSGVFGMSMSTQGSYGVKGISYATTGTNTGVYGASFAPEGFGIYGNAASPTGKNYGVYGNSKSSGGYGVYGFADANTGKTYGVYGQVNSDQGYGVYGFASSSSGTNCGIYGNSVSISGYGVLGAGWTGVRGQTSSSSGYGLEGICSSSTGGTMAVRGVVSSPDGYSGYFSGGKFYINGNTGIGIENPGAKLDVNGQVKITGGSPGAGKVLTSDASGLASWQPPSSGNGPGGSDGSVQFNSSGAFAGDDNLYWNRAVKRLGIGTNSPARPLTVSGGSSTGSSAGFVNDETGYGWFDGLTVGIGHTNEGLAAQLWCSENCALNFATNNISRMSIEADGKIGIGKYNPAFKVDVIGDRIRLNNAGETAWIAMRTDGSAGFLDFSFAGGKLAIGGTNAGENILLNPGTNSWVGVRTWNPQYELDVTGKIRATGGVYYGGNAGSADGSRYNTPDYVFDENYEKLSTVQVEEFLLKEKHLPWVTSAEEEKKENGNVTDMTRMAFETLEAVENLQLQLIAQDKLIRELKNDNGLLRERLEKLEKFIGTNTHK